VATAARAPTSDDAVSGTWSGVAGSRWTLVDDYPSVATNDLLTGGTAAAVITFGFSAFTVPSGSTGISVQVQYYDGEASNGANNCGGRLKVGGTYYNAATHNPSGTAGTSRSDNWATNPKSGAAWTVDDVNGVGVNALQAFGVSSTDSNPTWRFSSIQVQVTYTEPLVEILGEAAVTDAGDATSATGTAELQAASSISDAADTVSATATIADSAGITGAVTVADDADAMTAAGVVALTGAGSAIDADDGTSTAGTVDLSASGAAIDGNDTIGIAGSVALAATAAQADADDVIDTAGALSLAATSVVVDDADVTVIAGAVGAGVSGEMAASDAADVVVAAGQTSSTAATILDDCSYGWISLTRDETMEEICARVTALIGDATDAVATTLRESMQSGYLSRKEDAKMEQVNAWIRAVLAG
jgi:hypothetical protein